MKTVFPPHLHEFVCLESQRRLNEQLSVLRLVLEGGTVGIAERHVILGKTETTRVNNSLSPNFTVIHPEGLLLSYPLIGEGFGRLGHFRIAFGILNI